MGAAETKAGQEQGQEHIDRTSAVPWPQLDGERVSTSSAWDGSGSMSGPAKDDSSAQRRAGSEVLQSSAKIPAQYDSGAQWAAKYYTPKSRLG